MFSYDFNGKNDVSLMLLVIIKYCNQTHSLSSFKQDILKAISSET